MLPPRIDKEIVQRRIGAYADKSVTLEERGKIYEELLGFLPPRIEARLNVTGALDPKMVESFGPNFRYMTCRSRCVSTACIRNAST